MANSAGPVSNGPLGFDPTIIDVALTAGAAVAAGGINQIGPRFPLGTIVEDRSGNSYMYVKNTGSAITQYTICGYDSDYVIKPLTRALAAGGLGIAIPQMSGGFPAGSTTTQYGWAFCGPGAGSALGIASTTASVPLYTSASTGIAASAAAADYLLRGLKFTAATSSAGSAATALFTEALMYTAMTTNVAG